MKATKPFDSFSKWIIGIAMALILFAFLSPLIFTQFEFIDFSGTGSIGDTIGGIMNPFIGIASILIMFLAFYMQFNANKMIQSQFEKNQFENQFFEMLKTHKENSNLINSTYYETEEGRGFGEDVAYRQWLETRKKGFKFLVEQINQTYNQRKNNTSIISDDRNNFHAAYEEHWEDSFGHYFRHLFLIVKFIVTKPDNFLTYEEKRNYLRILRASLSTFEQIFLYYNWLSGYGSQWENENNHFLTDYRMIHNVDNRGIHQDFEIKKINPFTRLLQQNNYKKETDRKNDPLFELIN